MLETCYKWKLKQTKMYLLLAIIIKGNKTFCVDSIGMEINPGNKLVPKNRWMIIMLCKIVSQQMDLLKERLNQCRKQT